MGLGTRRRELRKPRTGKNEGVAPRHGTEVGRMTTTIRGGKFFVSICFWTTTSDPLIIWSSCVLLLLRHLVFGRRHRCGTCSSLACRFHASLFFIDICCCCFPYSSIRAFTISDSASGIRVGKLVRSPSVIPLVAHVRIHIIVSLVSASHPVTCF